LDYAASKKKPEMGGKATEEGSQAKEYVVYYEAFPAPKDISEMA
jgi:hypothetical protein